MSRFENRVVLITGSSGALGAVVTRAFHDQGATVIGVSSGTPPSKAGDIVACSITADLSTPEGARAAVTKTVERYKRIDALIHLVGGFAGGKPVHQTDDATWRHMLDINLHAAFYIMRAVLPPMLEAHSGRILAIGSRTGVEPVATLSAYGVSKAALIALVRTVAAEVRNSGITANVVLPSVIDTPANRAADAAADFTQWVKPESIASLLVWLASEEAGQVNGAVIPIYGRA